MKNVCGVMHPDREHYPNVVCNRHAGGNHQMHAGWHMRPGRVPERVRWNSLAKEEK